MVSITMSAVDPTGKQHRKCLNTSKYSKEECDVIIKEYRKWITSGHNPKMFNADNISISAQNQPLAIRIPEHKEEKEMFERKHIRDLEIDRSLGGFSFAIIGSTKSGKSYCTNYVVKNFFKKHITFLMSLTSHGEVYNQYRKEGIIAEKFCPELIEEAFVINKRTDNHYDFLFVFDDLALDGKNDKMMTRLLCTGRNVGCSAIISGQKATMLSATGRSNCNYLCLFYQNSLLEVESTIKSWLRCFFPRDWSLQTGVNFYIKATQDHNFFLVDTLNSKCFISRI